MLRKIQEREYSILKELDRICKKHNIKYFLAQGTLLGAAKYKKFIPWDDDIDILMPAKELLKLEKVFGEEASDEFMLTNYKREKHFPIIWSKIRAVNTLSRPARYKDLPINWGICIDIFSIYSLSNFSPLRKLEFIAVKLANKMLLAEFTKYEENHGFVVRVIEKIPICVRHAFADFVTDMLKLHSDSTKYVLVTCKGMKVVERKMLFGEAKELTFEDGIYPVPTDYHGYLTLNYGDYMAPLPEDQQRGHDLKMGDIEWNL